MKWIVPRSRLKYKNLLFANGRMQFLIARKIKQNTQLFNMDPRTYCLFLHIGRRYVRPINKRSADEKQKALGTRLTIIFTFLPSVRYFTLFRHIWASLPFLLYSVVSRYSMFTIKIALKNNKILLLINFVFTLTFQTSFWYYNFNPHWLIILFINVGRVERLSMH